MSSALNTTDNFSPPLQNIKRSLPKINRRKIYLYLVIIQIQYLIWAKQSKVIFSAEDWNKVAQLAIEDRVSVINIGKNEKKHVPDGSVSTWV